MSGGPGKSVTPAAEAINTNDYIAKLRDQLARQMTEGLQTWILAETQKPSRAPVTEAKKWEEATKRVQAAMKPVPPSGLPMDARLKDTMTAALSSSALTPKQREGLINTIHSQVANSTELPTLKKEAFDRLSSGEPNPVETVLRGDIHKQVLLDKLETRLEEQCAPKPAPAGGETEDAKKKRLEENKIQEENFKKAKDALDRQRKQSGFDPSPAPSATPDKEANKESEQQSGQQQGPTVLQDLKDKIYLQADALIWRLMMEALLLTPVMALTWVGLSAKYGVKEGTLMLFQRIETPEDCPMRMDMKILSGTFGIGDAQKVKESFKAGLDKHGTMTENEKTIAATRAVQKPTAIPKPRPI